MPRGHYFEFHAPLFFGILFVTSVLWGVLGIIFVPESLSLQQNLRSRVTADTPISGFYGPGSWWAWLITLGMSHGHTIKALWATGELPRGWDFDLIGAACYLVAATIDVILKSRAVAQLGNAASESALLPALVCAEFVVWLGSGFSFINLLTSLYFAGPSGPRNAGIAMIPLMFAFVASGFTIRAHRAIARTTPVTWCLSHHAIIPADKRDGVDPGHFPANIITFWTIWGSDSLRTYWFRAGVVTGAVTVLWLLGALWGRSTPRRAVWLAAKTGFYCVAVSSVILSIPSLYLTAIFAGLWFVAWLLLWWPVYVLAFFPQLGYFPPTGISVLEMDQIAALLAVAAVAAIRIGRAIFSKERAEAADEDPSSQELDPLLSVPDGILGTV
ncbi:hypothetical protein MVEN_01887400 [Mycena venus]|uniref:Uncharacterized protein n=1 Tax=Mycena venus TaxID=2733690 RepID=A0A8H7CKW6_9AGAR|nr:hypothetical protein MVEN_01887400 [Mycena venus]